MPAALPARCKAGGLLENALQDDLGQNLTCKLVVESKLPRAPGQVCCKDRPKIYASPRSTWLVRGIHSDTLINMLC